MDTGAIAWVQGGRLFHHMLFETNPAFVRCRLVLYFCIANAVLSPTGIGAGLKDMLHMS